MALFNTVEFRREISRNLNSVANLAYGAALSRFRSAQKELLTDYDKHPVTREIKDGGAAKNISNTLNGKGNLFGFIGFHFGSDPTSALREILAKSVRMNKKPSTEIKGSRINFKFEVVLPTLQEIALLTPLPWEEGRSWAVGIEEGISGFGRFMYWKVPPQSLSKAGIQATNELRGEEFKPTKYVSELLSAFKERLV